jgi:hypothetical protein
MFIIVRYGDDKRTIFNSCCTIKNLIKSIKKNCQISDNFELDLVDSNGLNSNLNSNLNDYANKVLKAKEIFILFKVESNKKN